MSTDETLRLRLKDVEVTGITAPSAAYLFARLRCAETRANVEYARAQVAEERMVWAEVAAELEKESERLCEAQRLTPCSNDIGERSRTPIPDPDDGDGQTR